MIRKSATLFLRRWPTCDFRRASVSRHGVPARRDFGSRVRIGYAGVAPPDAARVDFRYNALGQFTMIQRFRDLAGGQMAAYPTTRRASFLASTRPCPRRLPTSALSPAVGETTWTSRNPAREFVGVTYDLGVGKVANH